MISYRNNIKKWFGCILFFFLIGNLIGQEDSTKKTFLYEFSLGNTQEIKNKKSLQREDIFHYSNNSFFIRWKLLLEINGLDLFMGMELNRNYLKVSNQPKFSHLNDTVHAITRQYQSTEYRGFLLMGINKKLLQIKNSDLIMLRFSIMPKFSLYTVSQSDLYFNNEHIKTKGSGYTFSIFNDLYFELSSTYLCLKNGERRLGISGVYRVSPFYPGYNKRQYPISLLGLEVSYYF